MSAENTLNYCPLSNGEIRPFLKPGWSPLNTVLMVIGFVAFFPLGLVMLAWNLWGHRWVDEQGDFKRAFTMQRNWAGDDRRWRASSMSKTGNTAFDEYRAVELAHLEEERRKFDDMRREFDDHLNNLRRARDQKEFDDFMDARRSQNKDTDEAGQ